MYRVNYQIVTSLHGVEEGFRNGYETCRIDTSHVGQVLNYVIIAMGNVTNNSHPMG